MFINGLSYDTDNASDYKASSYRMINEWWIGMKTEEAAVT
jgi:hypothetical protein